MSIEKQGLRACTEALAAVLLATDGARRAARKKHRPFASWHEAYAVILEELEEAWATIKADKTDPAELIQVAACCQLAILELYYRSGDDNDE